MKLSLRTVSALICAAGVCLGQSSDGAKPGPGDAAPAVSVPAQPPAGDVAPTADPAKATVAANPPGKGKPYVIGPLDVLEISVWNEVKLSRIYDVSSDGTISMPLIGLVKADGLTTLELAAKIQEKLLTLLNSPEVNVQVLKNNSKKYYILGGVLRTGEFPLNGETTVLDAFASCGGFKEFANTKKVRILRGNKTYYFNYKEASRGKHPEQNIVLQNGDHIFVDE